MADTPNLELERLVEGQASGEITHNLMVNKMDSLVMPAIKDRDLTAPPGGESEGDRYLVKATATGGWIGEDGNLAIYYSGWVFIPPQEGWRLWVDDENILIYYDGAAWQEVGILGATQTKKGVVELATDAEAIAGTDTTRAIAPSTWTAAFNARIKYVPKDLTEGLTNSTTLQDDDEIKFTIATTRAYHCRCVLFIHDDTTGATAGFKMKWAVPANSLIEGYYILGDRTADDVDAMEIFDETTTIVLTPDGTDYTPVVFDFILRTDLTGGDLQLQWAQQVLDATEYIYVRGIDDGWGSNLIVTYLGAAP
jgi:hypothetical protein